MSLFFRVRIEVQNPLGAERSPAATEVVEIIHRISVASDEQSRSVVQVNQSVDQISGVVQTNSAAAEKAPLPARS